MASSSPLPTLTVAELLTGLERSVAKVYPGPVWVRGEVSSFRRTAGGAAYFRLADSDSDRHSLSVAARGLVMREVERSLEAAGVGALRDGVALRIRGTVGVDMAHSQVRLLLLEVDPAFTAGRLAVDRAEVLRRLAADGSLARNRSVPLPLVPLSVGLVTSRGSAAHADFLGQLRSSGYRFRVLTASARMQGEGAEAGVVTAMAELARRGVDVMVLTRGGGSKLDLAIFDREEVGRAVAACPVPVVTGIGHEIDHSVADAAAAVALKTPSAAGEWLVARVGEFSHRLAKAHQAIAGEARHAHRRARARLDRHGLALAGARQAIDRQAHRLSVLSQGIGEAARTGLDRHAQRLDRLDEVISALGVEATLRRGYALVTGEGGRVVRLAAGVAEGDRLQVRWVDGTVPVRVEGEP